jgi:hypothetical protein
MYFAMKDDLVLIDGWMDFSLALWDMRFAIWAL